MEDSFTYPTPKDIKTICKTIQEENHTSTIETVNGTRTLNACRGNLGVDPVLRIRMTKGTKPLYTMAYRRASWH